MISAEHPHPGPTSTTTLRLTGPSLTIARVAWLIIALICLGMFLADLPRYHEMNRADIPDIYGSILDENTQTLYGIFLLSRRAVTYAVLWLVALVIFWRRSDSAVALLLSGGLMVAGANLLLIPLTFREPVPALSQSIVGLTAAFISYLGILFQIAIFYILPDGHFVPRWSRWAFLAWAVILTFVLWFLPVPYVGQIVNYGFVPFLAIGLYAQAYRFRHLTDPVQRQQIKWVSVGALIAGVVGVFYLVLIPAFFPVIHENPTTRLLFIGIGGTLWHIALLCVPVSFMIAALRYRLWDVDIVVNRSLVYSALTAILGLIYFVGIVLLQAILGALTGGEERSSIAIVISTLVIAALFQPIRKRLQTVIDHRFPNPLSRYKPPHETSTIITPPLTGTRFGAYEVLQPLGKGGMAEIYKGRHTSLQREVAIKVLHSTFSTDPEFRARFEREAQTVATLRHPNIVQVFDFGEEDKRHYMVMEFINGYDLSRFLRENGRLHLNDALPVLREIGSALDYAHDQGLIHRDVKPSNILLQPITGIHVDKPLGNVRAILTDFGVAKIAAAGSDLTKTGVVGTLDYLAPEQIIAPKDIDRRADVYAFGAMAYEMLTGQPPFKSDNYGAVLYAHLQQAPPDARAIVPDLPEHAAEAIRRALAKDRSERYMTASAFVAGLAEKAN